MPTKDSDSGLKNWPPGSGAAARHIREFHWEATPLGPIAGWPQSLKTAVDIVLASGHAMQLAWGPERTILYNDYYAPMLGERHPAALGMPFHKAWPDVWEDIEPLVDRAFSGETVRFENMPLLMTRHGYPEETWWNFSYSPVRDEAGEVAGLLNVTVDSTSRVRADRAERDRERALEALRESEERQVFLLKFSDVVRPLIDPAQIKLTATRLLGEQLAVNRVFYADADNGYWIVTKGYEEGIEPLPNRPFSMSEYGDWIINGFKAGRRLVVDDMSSDTRFAQSERDAHIALQIGAEVAVPLVKNGELLAMLVAHNVHSRKWSEQDLAILQETAERTWASVEWSSAQGALNDSEEKYRTLFDAIDEGVMILEKASRADGRRDYRYVAMNSVSQRMFGTGDLTGQSVRDNFPDEDDGWYELYDQAIRTGEVKRFERAAESQGMVLQMYLSRVGAPEHQRVMVVMQNVTDRKRAEIALRESEKLQAFLLKLSDALRTLDTPQTIMETATRLLREHLGANRCGYYEIEGDEYVIRSDSANGVPTLVGRYPLRMFGSGLLEKHLGGQSPIVVDDVALSHDVAESQAFAAIDVGAYIGVTLFKQSRFVSGLTVHSVTPRKWSANEVAIAQETAERTWAAVERAHAQAALRESEERFREFGEASLDVLWIRDADTLRWTYLTPAFEEIYGISREEALGARDFRTWIELILPEDRDVVLEGVEQIRKGERAAFEYRITRPSDGEVRWLRNTDFPITDDTGRVAMIGGIGHDITHIKQAAEHQKLLLAELQHRVRNTLAVIRSITRMTAESSQSVEEMGMHLDGRIAAFARVQAAVTRAPMKGIDLETLIADTLSSAAREGEEFVIDGPSFALSPKSAETFALVFHELMTNAIKYGALSAKTGHVAIRWNCDEDFLKLQWVETGVRLGAATAMREGFGTELLTRSLAYEMKADVEQKFTPDGVRYSIRAPIARVVKA